MFRASLSLNWNRHDCYIVQEPGRIAELVEIAGQGEDVVITVEGKPKARLTRSETIVRPRELIPEEKEQ